MNRGRAHSSRRRSGRRGRDRVPRRGSGGQRAPARRRPDRTGAAGIEQELELGPPNEESTAGFDPPSSRNDSRRSRAPSTTRSTPSRSTTCSPTPSILGSFRCCSTAGARKRRRSVRTSRLGARLVSRRLESPVKGETRSGSSLSDRSRTDAGVQCSVRRRWRPRSAGPPRRRRATSGCRWPRPR